MPTLIWRMEKEQRVKARAAGRVHMQAETLNELLDRIRYKDSVIRAMQYCLDEREKIWNGIREKNGR